MPKLPSLEPFTYILREDRDLPEEDQVRFLLRPLKFREWEQLQKRRVTITKDEGTTLDLDTGAIARKILNFGLLGWENWPKAPSFQRVTEHGRDIVPDNMLDLIAPWATELANAITDRSALTEQETKNSSAPSP